MAFQNKLKRFYFLFFIHVLRIGKSVFGRLKVLFMWLSPWYFSREFQKVSKSFMEFRRGFPLRLLGRFVRVSRIAECVFGREQSSVYTPAALILSEEVLALQSFLQFSRIFFLFCFTYLEGEPHIEPSCQLVECSSVCNDERISVSVPASIFLEEVILRCPNPPCINFQTQI